MERADPEQPARGAPEDARIEAIVAAGRTLRRRSSRGAWSAALIVGAICAFCFVYLLALDGEPGAGSPAEPPRASARGGATGCVGGLGLGLGLGVAIGFALARRQPPDHSSRKRP